MFIGFWGDLVISKRRMRNYPNLAKLYYPWRFRGIKNSSVTEFEIFNKTLTKKRPNSLHFKIRKNGAHFNLDFIEDTSLK